MNNDYVKALEQQQQVEQMKEAFIFNYLNKDARERFKRVELVNPGLANKALMISVQAVSQGRLKSVDDLTLKKILKELDNKKEINIVRK